MPLRELFDLSGKTAIVTGASRGIGAAIARALAECGANVVLNGRKEMPLAALAAELQANGSQALPVAGHVGNAADRQQLVQRAIDQWGGVDILVNNAATNPVLGPATQVDEAAFDKIMSVNLKAPFELCKQVFPLLRQRGGGAIVNVSSVGGLRPEPLLGIYSVSKAALLSLTQVLAQEGAADGIRVNAICPGLVRTQFSAALWQNDTVLQAFLSRVPLQRMAEPAEIAPLVVFLASRAGSYCTGGVYTIDGGHTI